MIINKYLQIVLEERSNTLNSDSILNTFLTSGKGKDLTENDVDPEEFKMGLKVEAEHWETIDIPELQSIRKQIIKKIVLDHLAERSDYYSFGKKCGIFDELKGE